MAWPGWTIPSIEAVSIVKKSCEAIIKEIKKIERTGNDPYQMRLADVMELLEDLYKSKEYQ